jgi:hypothetical protein
MKPVSEFSIKVGVRPELWDRSSVATVFKAVRFGRQDRLGWHVKVELDWALSGDENAANRRIVYVGHFGCQLLTRVAYLLRVQRLAAYPYPLTKFGYGEFLKER